jgi:hypothetical protein
MSMFLLLTGLNDAEIRGRPHAYFPLFIDATTPST